MNFSHSYNHHNGVTEWEGRELNDWLTDIFEAPQIKLREGCTKDIRAHVRLELEKEALAINVRIDQGLGLSVFAMKDDLAIHLQTGNMSRAPYDLLKLQHLYQSNRIKAAALAVPTKVAAQKLGSNVAYAERIQNELQLFQHIITVPIMLVAFE